MTARLDKAEATLQATLATLDGTLRAHTQDAVGATQAAVETLAAQVHLLETARGLTDSSPQTGGSPNGRWRSGEQDPVAGAFRIRIQELEAKQTEANAKAYALEADLFSALAKLSDRSDAHTQELAQQLEALG